MTLTEQITAATSGLRDQERFAVFAFANRLRVRSEAVQRLEAHRAEISARDARNVEVPT